MKNLRPTACAALLAVLATLACQPTEPPAEEQAAPAAERVENPALGIALARVPTGFRLDANDGETLRLVTADPELPGTLTFEAGPVEQAGINLPEAVQRQKEHVESLPQGKFLGQVELMGPTGTAYSTRGRYLTPEGTDTEEIRMFTLHPSGENRMLSLIYVYPPVGDSRERINQGMIVLGEVEGLAAPVPEAAATPPEETTSPEG